MFARCSGSSRSRTVASSTTVRTDTTAAARSARFSGPALDVVLMGPTAGCARFVRYRAASARGRRGARARWSRRARPAVRGALRWSEAACLLAQALLETRILLLDSARRRRRSFGSDDPRDADRRAARRASRRDGNARLATRPRRRRPCCSCADTSSLPGPQPGSHLRCCGGHRAGSSCSTMTEHTQSTGSHHDHDHSHA